MIPAFLSFDVEPDGFQLSRREPRDWSGYAHMAEWAGTLRSRLAGRSGVVPRFGWYVRMDPQVEEVYGRADHVLTAFQERTDRLEAAGDYFGVHAHPLRWFPSRHAWVHDLADRHWLSWCVRFSLDAFAGWRGEPARRYRAGAGFMNDDVVAVLDASGVAVELALEPVAGWWLTASTVACGVDESPIEGRYPDVAGAPRRPYRPSRDDFRAADGPGARRLVMIPVSTYGEPAAEADARGGRRGPPAKRVHVLYPGIEWPNPETFWDLLARELPSMARPYVSLGIRTDAPGTAALRRALRVLEALPAHPLAAELAFVDPLEAVSALL